jgi:signal transduction histidine kinase
VVEITTDLDAAVPPVVGTESQLRQVLFNLIANGAQAVEEKMARSGSVEKGFVRIRSRLLQDKVELSFEDSGIRNPARRSDQDFRPVLYHQRGWQRNGSRIDGGP